MDSKRFLLPFTQDIDRRALEYAVQFARGCQATLVPLVLFPLLEHQGTDEPRLEMIEQANDFLEAVTFQSGQAGVGIEPGEMSTRDAVQSISLFAQEMMCQGILLFLSQRTAVLLPPEVVKRLLEQVPCPLYLVHLYPANRRRPVQMLLKWCSDHIRCWQRPQEETQPSQASAVSPGEIIHFQRDR